MPFCDYLNCTTPKDHGDGLMESVRPVLDAAGCYAVSDTVYGFEGGGAVKHQLRGAVYMLSASGQVLELLRAMNLYQEYLRAVSEHPWRVSLLHATEDIPVHAPPVVQRLYHRATRGAVSLSRKAVQGRNVSWYKSCNAEGEDTGTVYLGRRTSEVWAKVYDKRQERLDNAGLDIGPCLRVEVSVSGKQGVSLRDAWEPGPVFYHYASPSLVERPPGVPAWVPAGEGFELPPRVPLLPAVRLRRRFNASLDLDELLSLADQVGPHGIDMLHRMLDQRWTSRRATTNTAEAS
jgi:hypothetical protein